MTPAGRVIWHKGIAPDVTVSLLTNVAPLIPEAEQGMTTDQLHASGDEQLLQAIDVLSPPASQ